MTLKRNVVFEGGGVKGVGLVGALAALEGAYSFDGIAGTSAGAIVASLLSAGYNANEMKNILDNTDYTKFKQKDCLDKLGPPGMAASIFIGYGIYSADYFESWLNGLLNQKNVSVFGDIKNKPSANGQKYKFQAIASDITSKRLLVLPDDLERLGYDIDGFSVAKAVRMSMSIPVFFEPVKLSDKLGRTHIIVDGGLLSNYPLWLFEKSPAKTIGIRFLKSGEEMRASVQQPVNGFIDYLKRIVDTMLEAHDKQHIHTSNGDFGKTVFISPEIHANGKSKSVKATDFEITRIETDALFQNGKEAAERFIKRDK